jgi:hypothetical protein
MGTVMVSPHTFNAIEEWLTDRKERVSMNPSQFTSNDGKTVSRGRFRVLVWSGYTVVESVNVSG